MAAPVASDASSFYAADGTGGSVSVSPPANLAEGEVWAVWAACTCFGGTVGNPNESFPAKPAIPSGWIEARDCYGRDETPGGNTRKVRGRLLLKRAGASESAVTIEGDGTWSGSGLSAAGVYAQTFRVSGVPTSGNLADYVTAAANTYGFTSTANFPAIGSVPDDESLWIGAAAVADDDETVSTLTSPSGVTASQVATGSSATGSDCRLYAAAGQADSADTPSGGSIALSASQVWGSVAVVLSSVPAVTEVSDTLEAVWAVRDAVSDAVALEHDVRAAVADGLEVPWATRAALADALEVRWATRDAVASALALEHDVRAVAADALSSPWAVRVALADALEARWSVREVALGALMLEHDVRGAVADASALEWDTRAAVAPALALEWSVRGALLEALALEWSVRAATAAALDAPWQVRAGVSDAAALEWALAAVIADSARLRWNTEALGEVATSLEAVWAVRAVLEDALVLRHGVRTVVAPASLEAPWAVRAALTPASLVLEHAVRAALADSLEARWSVRSAVSPAASVLRWAVRDAIRRDRALRFATMALATDSVTLRFRTGVRLTGPIVVDAGAGGVAVFGEAEEMRVE